VQGHRRMVDGMPASDRTSHTVVPRRWFSTRARKKCRSRHVPAQREIGQVGTGVATDEVEDPCPPGFIPVAKVDHATGVWAGYVVSHRAYPPAARRRARLGSSPDAIIGSTMLGSSPSSR
jgi:hypothetical protein